MKTIVTVLILGGLLIAGCSPSAKEIPMEPMAKIIMKMSMENKLGKDQHPKDMDNAVIEPFTRAEGFSAADFKYTVELIDKDEKKQKEFDEIMSKMMMDEMMKALEGTDMGTMMKSMTDSLKAAVDSSKK